MKQSVCVFCHVHTPCPYKDTRSQSKEEK